MWNCRATDGVTFATLRLAFSPSAGQEDRSTEPPTRRAADSTHFDPMVVDTGTLLLSEPLKEETCLRNREFGAALIPAPV